MELVMTKSISSKDINTHVDIIFSVSSNCSWILWVFFLQMSCKFHQPISGLTGVNNKRRGLPSTYSWQTTHHTNQRMACYTCWAYSASGAHLLQWWHLTCRPRKSQEGIHQTSLTIGHGHVYMIIEDINFTIWPKIRERQHASSWLDDWQILSGYQWTEHQV